MAADPLRKGGSADEPPEPYAPLGWAPPPAPPDPWEVRPPQDRDRPAYGPPAYGPPAYGPVPWAPPSGAQETSDSAVIALVLAVSSFLLLPLLPAVAALVVARRAEREIAAARGSLAGAGLARAARVVAWLNLGLCVLVALGLVLLVSAVAAQLP